MKKVPTIFDRDWEGDRNRVVNKINPKAQWGFDGEGWPTRKLDGTSCMIPAARTCRRAWPPRFRKPHGAICLRRRPSQKPSQRFFRFRRRDRRVGNQLVALRLCAARGA